MKLFSVYCVCTNRIDIGRIEERRGKREEGRGKREEGRGKSTVADLAEKVQLIPKKSIYGVFDNFFREKPKNYICHAAAEVLIL